MTIKNIMIAVAGVAAIGGVCFLAALVRETGRWLSLNGFPFLQDHQSHP